MLKKYVLCLFFALFSFTSLAVGYDQVVVMSLDSILQNTSDYNLSGASIVSSAIGAEGNNIGDVISQTYSKVGNFSGTTGNLSYSGGIDSEKMAVFSLDKNTSTTEMKNVYFTREITTNYEGKDVKNYLISENFSLPISGAVNLTNVSTDSGAKFTYNEGNAKAAHLLAYKNQQFLIRIVKGNSSVDFDVINKTGAIKTATTIEQNFTTNGQYSDFIVDSDQYDRQQTIKSKNGAYSLKFLPGSIELFGLPQGNYIIEVYSLKYTEDSEVSGSCIITKENVLGFTTTEDTDDYGMYIKSFSTDDFPMNIGEIYTVSNLPLASITVKDSKSGIELYSGLFTPESTTTVGPKVYQVWKINYTLLNGTSMDGNLHNVKISGVINGSTVIKSLSYSIGEQNPIVNTKYPHQTVFAYFDTAKTWSGNYVISDRDLNRYTYGYRGVKTVNTTTGSNMFVGNWSAENEMSFDNYLFSWQGNNDSKKGVMISKVISNSKATFAGAGGAFTYYTTNGITGLTYDQESTSRAAIASLSWTAPEKNSYGATLSQDKIMFRIVPLSSANATETIAESYSVKGVNYSENLPIKYYGAYNNNNPIVQGNELGTTTPTTALSNFASAPTNYIDLIFDANTQGDITAGDASFTYSGGTAFQMSGLPRGYYLVQVYSIQNSHLGAEANYRVLTYGGYKKVEIGLPQVVSGTFAKQNNVFLITNKDYTSGYDSNTNTAYKKVNAEFITKSQTKLSLGINNLIAKNSEGTTTGSIKATAGENVTEQRNRAGQILPVSNLNISNSKNDFQFPLDIVLCIDNTGSMQSEIDATKNSLNSFVTQLNERGFNVNFNVITFGDRQYLKGIAQDDTSGILDGYSKDSRTPYLAIYKTNGEWYSTTSSVINILGAQVASGGFHGGQENGAWALDRATDYLSNWGRYLDNNNNIVTYGQLTPEQRSSYVKSQKMIIFLTDENMDTEKYQSYNSARNSLNYTPGNTGSFPGGLTQKILNSNINLVGIYHTGVVDKTDSYGASTGTDTTAYATTISGLYPASRQAVQYVTYGNVANSENTYFIETESGTNYKYITNVTSAGAVETIHYFYDNANGGTPRTLLNTGSNYWTDIGSTNGTRTRLNISSRTMYVFKDALGHISRKPSEIVEMPYTRLGIPTVVNGKSISMGDLFLPYEMGDNGEFVNDALLDASSKIGIVQTWKLNYTSPFSESDGLEREIIFSLTNLPNVQKWDLDLGKVVVKPLEINPIINEGDRFYRVKQEKIKALFENPDPATLYFTKKDGNYDIKAIAQSQYIDDDGKLVNFPIIRGTFVITDEDDPSKTFKVSSEDSGNSKVRISDFKSSQNDIWYRAISSIDENSTDGQMLENIRKNKHTLKIDFIAETSEDTKTISIKGVQIVEADAPRIKGIKLTNSTLADFMSQLGVAGNKTFTESEIDSASKVITSSSIDGLNNSIDFDKTGLNVKAGDKINIEFTIQDESVIPTAGGFLISDVSRNGSNKIVSNKVGGLFQITYNNIVYSLTSSGISVKYVENSYTSSSGISKWEVIGLPYSDTVNNFSVKIIDGSIIKDPVTGKVGNETAGKVDNAFKVPDLLDNTNFQANTSNPVGKVDLNVEYYNSSLKVENPNAEALGYLVVFDKDYSKRDTSGPGLETGIVYQQVSGKDMMSAKYSSNIAMAFNDGYYEYAQVYAFNKAGAVKNITTGTTTEWTLSEVVKGINKVTKDKKFYVDHVAPRISGEVFYKTADANTELNTIDIAKSLLTGENKPYKVGDTVGISATAIDYNFYKSKEITSGSSITLTNNLGVFVYTGVPTNDPVEIKCINGLANDQTPTQGEKNVEILVDFYDKAGNLTTKTIKVIYDDRIPDKVVTKSEKEGVTSDSTSVSRKYTKNSGLPLIASSDTVPLALGMVMGGTDKYFGDISGIGTTSSVNLTTFEKTGSPYTPSSNALNTLTLSTYSHSGQKYESKSSNSYTDSIVLDTDINYNVPVVKTLNENYNLGNYIKEITELVGLEKFEIKQISGPNSKLTGSINKKELNEFLSGTAKEIQIINSKYYSTILASPLNETDSYIIELNGGAGTYIYELEFYDRLGNHREIRFNLTLVSNPIDIIGKTNNSSIELKSKANQNNGKIKIESRTER